MIRIIICDDEIHIRNGLKKMIEQADMAFRVTGMAANGNEACALIGDQKPDVVLMDINMPGMNGLDVIRAFAGELPETDYVIISGYDDFAYARKAVQLGAYDYLLKPVDTKELLSILQTINQKHSEKKEVSLAEKICQYVNENYRQPDLSLSLLARQFHVSESYLTRVIKKECGKNYTEYLNYLRLEKAKELLRQNSSLQSQEAAAQVGYMNKHYFCRIFKQYTGDSPIEFQKKANVVTNRENVSIVEVML